jgi:hypothetical protein
MVTSCMSVLILPFEFLTAKKFTSFICVRAQQQEQRILREKIQQEIDPGNPYWELIKMIR